MRLLSAEEQQKLAELTAKRVEVTLLEVTGTGLNKAIMDATAPVRSFFSKHRLHDYSSQKQGQEHKVQNTIGFILDSGIIPSTISLYRPQTKHGDPRLWISKLKSFASGGDLIAIMFYQNSLYAFNLTQLDVRGLLGTALANPLKDIVSDINSDAEQVASELLSRLRALAKLGFIKAVGTGDTAIGRTLETSLGIAINSSKKPDYKGIELKSFRGKKSNRKTLFAQVPDWQLSKVKSSKEILELVGYSRGDTFKLYCTVSTLIRNPQGLQLRLDRDKNILFENSDNPTVGDFVLWQMRTLHSRLLEKHNETFWVKAESQMSDGKEYFKFIHAEHTRSPIVTQFDILLEQGLITLDHLIKKNNLGRVCEKGPLFKVKPDALSLLFPPSSKYILC